MLLEVIKTSNDCNEDNELALLLKVTKDLTIAKHFIILSTLYLVFKL